MIASGAASGGTAGPWRGGCIEGQSVGMGVRDVHVRRHTSTGPLGASVTEIEKRRVGGEDGNEDTSLIGTHLQVPTPLKPVHTTL